MSAQVLDGKATAARIKAELTERVTALRERGITPGLGTILVGDDPGSRSYVAGKHRDCAEVGIESIRVDLPGTASEEEIAAAIDQLNADPTCTGYIVQLPLPAGVDTNALLERIDPDKDADGLHPTNLGRLVLRVKEPVTSPLPCTPRAVIELLERYDVELDGAHVAVIGRGTTVGRSIGLLLTRRDVNATVTLTHTGTRDLGALVRQADVVVAELVAADSTPALAWALATGSLVVGSDRLATIGIPALAADPEDVVERLREVIAAPDDAELRRLRQAGLEFAAAVHGGQAVETIERTLFPRPVWDDRAARGDERETPTQRPAESGAATSPAGPVTWPAPGPR